MSIRMSSVRRAFALMAALVVLSIPACSGSTTTSQQPGPQQPRPQPQDQAGDSVRKPDDKQPVAKLPDNTGPGDKKTPVEKKPADKSPKGPVVVSPEKLGQELTDDVVKNYPRYFGSVLEIKGVVHKRTESKESIVRIDFQVPVKLKDGKKDDFVVFCGLKSPVPLKDPAAGDLAVGKTVTVRGKLSAGGNGQATLYDCEIVRE